MATSNESNKLGCEDNWQDKFMATTVDEVWQLLGELIQAQKETERLLQEQSQKTDRQIQSVNEQIGKLGNRLGEFAEWQVRPAAVRLFRERGIAVRELSANISVQDGNEGIEIDLLVVNGSEAIAIEVKSKLSQADVDEHIERLSKIKRFMPRYENIKFFGAVAAMVIPIDVARYAYRQGIFVIGQSGDNMVLLNDLKFQPRGW
jgi:hypothetical protein